MAIFFTFTDPKLPVDPEDSSSYELVDRNGFNITYLDGRNIAGDYFNDTVTLGDIKIENQQLGLATSSVRGTGLMGLGYKANVAASTEYPTILDNMVSQGVISTHAFSMYLVSCRRSLPPLLAYLY
jgi:hypothetical protein